VQIPQVLKVKLKAQGSGQFGVEKKRNKLYIGFNTVQDMQNS
jgi:hypothetical protein